MPHNVLFINFLFPLICRELEELLRNIRVNKQLEEAHPVIKDSSFEHELRHNHIDSSVKNFEQRFDQFCSLFIIILEQLQRKDLQLWKGLSDNFFEWHAVCVQHIFVDLNDTL